MTQIGSYRIEDCGEDNSQYFPGRSTAYTDYDVVFVGVGDNAVEAFEDACDSAAQAGYDTTPVEDDAGLTRISAHAECDEDEDEEHDWQHYVALYIREGRDQAMTMLSVEEQDRVDAILHYLRLRAEIQPVPEGIATLPPQLLLQYGRAWPTSAHTYEGERGEPKSCYANSYRLMARKPALTYVEGYIICMGVPVEHAWCVDADGNVIDPTLAAHPDIGGYFGIPFSPDFVRATAFRTEVFGILPNNEELYRKGPPTGAICTALEGQAWKR